jgi:predicted lipoprotein with Yx(FWY)xxD motif
MRRSILAAPLVFAVLLAACSTGGGAAATSAPSQATASQSTASTAPITAPSTGTGASASPDSSGATAETYEVKVASGTVGGATASFLTGENDMTLYTFTPDQPNSGKSTCSGQCATNWPPFTVDSKDELKAGTGVTGALDVITRDDGSMQATYKGMPLYYFAADKKAGDTTGQGVGGKWFVVAP